MGYGNYSHDAHQALTQARAALPRQKVFTQSHCHALMDPKGVRARECRDSPEHPNSLGIVFALDVTGSMGDIPEHLARKELPKFMQILADCQIADPQLLFAAVGDATSDNAPLQVGQFESTAELMDQWLTWTYLEGRGGGQQTESYELALYFFAEHTILDCVTKRQHRGYLFMTGDELPYPAVSKHQVDSLIGDSLDEDIPVEELIAGLRTAYHPFFLVPDQQRRAICETRWRDLLGDQVICMDSSTDTCYVAAGCVALTEGVVTDLDDFARRASAAGATRARLSSIVTALSPYAELLGRSGVPHPIRGAVPGESGGFWRRLVGR